VYCRDENVNIEIFCVSESKEKHDMEITTEIVLPKINIE
jgi:hypothetical protein